MVKKVDLRQHNIFREYKILQGGYCMRCKLLYKLLYSATPCYTDHVESPADCHESSNAQYFFGSSRRFYAGPERIIQEECDE